MGLGGQCRDLKTGLLGYNGGWSWLRRLAREVERGDPWLGLAMHGGEGWCVGVGGRKREESKVNPLLARAQCCWGWVSGLTQVAMGGDGMGVAHGCEAPNRVRSVREGGRERRGACWIGEWGWLDFREGPWWPNAGIWIELL